MEREANTGIFLGTAAFFSGFSWQPTVNFLVDSGFNSTLLGTGAVCGLMFFAGLRIGRIMYHGYLKGIEKPTYANLKADSLPGLALPLRETIEKCHGSRLHERDRGRLGWRS